jgi:hypothetical protein
VEPGLGDWRWEQWPGPRRGRRGQLADSGGSPVLQLGPNTSPSRAKRRSDSATSRAAAARCVPARGRRPRWL